VSTCITNASRGDTVSVSAGAASWNTQLSLSKGVKLIGSGSGSTIITFTAALSPAINIVPDATAIANEEVIRLSGFTFDGTNTVTQFINVRGASPSGTKPWRYLIIDHNKFANQGGGTPDPAIYVLGGQTRGVIYLNIFDRCDMILRPHGANTFTEWTNSAYNNFSYGSADQLFFEDNTILWSSPYTNAGNTGMIQGEQGGRAVVRYNHWDPTNLSSQTDFSDTHGFQGFPGNGQTGEMIVEYYGNTLTAPSGPQIFQLFNHRGSQGMYHNNVFTGSSTPIISANQYPGGCNAAVGNGDGTLYNGEINNTYVFNNSVNGTISGMVVGPNNACGDVENTNWWNYNAACTSSSCSAGIGTGTTPPTGTCTTGVGYWVASTPTPTPSSAVIQSAHFYKCTSPNTWTLYYTPYTYPHPLRTGSSSSVFPPSNLAATVQ